MLRQSRYAVYTEPDGPGAENRQGHILGKNIAVADQVNGFRIQPTGFLIRCYLLHFPHPRRVKCKRSQSITQFIIIGKPCGVIRISWRHIGFAEQFLLQGALICKPIRIRTVYLGEYGIHLKVGKKGCRTVAVNLYVWSGRHAKTTGPVPDKSAFPDPTDTQE